VAVSYEETRRTAKRKLLS